MGPSQYHTFWNRGHRKHYGGGSSKDLFLGFLFILILVNLSHFAQPVPSWWTNGPPEIISLSPAPDSYIWGDSLTIRWEFQNNSQIDTDSYYWGYIRNFSLNSPVEGESVTEWGLKYRDYRREYVYNFSENHFTNENLFQKLNFTFVICYLAGADEWGPGYPEYAYSVEYTWMGYGLGNFSLSPVLFFIILLGLIMGLAALAIYLIYRIRRMKRHYH